VFIRARYYIDRGYARSLLEYSGEAKTIRK